jgi:purine-nucleoside phosphorylase
MSTVPEVVAARHAGLEVVAVSCITNMAAGMEDAVLTEEDVLETSQKTAGDFIKLSIEIIENIG